MPRSTAGPTLQAARSVAKAAAIATGSGEMYQVVPTAKLDEMPAAPF